MAAVRVIRGVIDFSIQRHGGRPSCAQVRLKIIVGLRGTGQSWLMRFFEFRAKLSKMRIAREGLSTGLSRIEMRISRENSRLEINGDALYSRPS